MHKDIQSISLLICDIDGVMTNGEIIFTENGDQLKIFNGQDGAGIKYWHRSGLIMGIISGRSSNTVVRRMKELGVKEEYIFQGYKKKLLAYEELKSMSGLHDENIAYIGDDLPDLPVMKKVGFPISVPNGVEEVQDIARFITSKEGGKGAVREAIEYILKAQNKWAGIMANY